ncbi:methylmalonyl-CoA epimerase [Thermosulfidibacter takaii ABI70S6]|uniref:Methylmalonyl-CoA epimerase n=1 Tax=Thermosulfidibacter takaii (strain DSM 17441 / JCM 13301 / NBRC 103674 / ABI70S6) TaxID=1298851 RepID=A0A0S3QUZ6_THET7|nr:methylmalonyl-CoA epimerase [Thermosulfidibacter takaii]BAT72148.1 methylmalonyl-CoA epimerase [Thermosulfidibacter takaii ABI70S6]
MLKKVNHIGIAVKSIDEAKKLYELMGLKVEGYEVVEEQKVKVAFIQVGETRIELLEATSDDSPVAKFIEKRGEGIHHIAFEVDDIEQALKVLKENGIKLIDEKPRKGAHNTKIAFVHPKSTNGVLMEICQEG